MEELNLQVSSIQYGLFSISSVFAWDPVVMGLLAWARFFIADNDIKKLDSSGYNHARLSTWERFVSSVIFERRDC